MSKSMFPHLEAVKGFTLGSNGLVSPGKGQKGPWVHRGIVMDAALADVAPLLAKIKKLQAKLAASPTEKQDAALREVLSMYRKFQAKQKGQHGKTTKSRDTTEESP